MNRQKTKKAKRQKKTKIQRVPIERQYRRTLQKNDFFCLFAFFVSWGNYFKLFQKLE